MTTNEILDARLDGVKMPRKMSVKIDKTGTGKDDPSYVINVAFDYTGWTVRQVLDSLANSSVAITFAGMLRKQEPDIVKSYNNKTILVSDAGKSPKTVIDVQASYAAMFAAMSPEEQLAELEKFEAMKKATA